MKESVGKSQPRVSETISPNTTIAQYMIVSKIGEGGMGEVYRGRDLAVRLRSYRSAALPERVIRVTRDIQNPMQSRGYLEEG